MTQVLADGTNTYLYGNDRLAQYEGAMQYFGPDALGSVRQIYDASAQVVGSARYDPFGSVMAQSGATSVFAFAGEQQDGTGLTYLRARYYSSAQGRFTTRDTWEGDPNAPMSYNAWNYTNGNPVNYADPAGMSTGAMLPAVLPRTASMCVEPAPDHSKPSAHSIFHGGTAFIYCGEFALTAYQFVEDQGYLGSPSTIPVPAPASGATPVPTSTAHPATTTSVTFGEKAVPGFSSEFL